MLDGSQPLLILAAIIYLYRARRAVRELHPPVHDPDDVAVSRQGALLRCSSSVWNSPSSR